MPDAGRFACDPGTVAWLGFGYWNKRTAYIYRDSHYSEVHREENATCWTKIYEQDVVGIKETDHHRIVTSCG